MNLFDPFPQRSLVLRNRLLVAPMCQYSAVDGVPDDWHLAHLGSRAAGGAGAVIAEATAVSPEGRISAYDTGLWNQAQAEAWRPIADFIKRQGSVAGMQLAHAGRKASTLRPWDGHGPIPDGEGGWPTVAPSAVPYDDGWNQPHALDEAGIQAVVDDFRNAARRALDAGFQLIELHAAHGYLLHQFLSPLSNRRNDRYGGSFENRSRLTLEVIRAVREVWPEELPLWMRISATDWAPEDGPRGWDVEQSVQLAREAGSLGVDLIDVSSGGLLPHVQIPLAPGYQVPFAAQIRREAGIATGAVGLITDAAQAAAIVANGEADVVLTARESLRDPYFPRRAAKLLGSVITAPLQYQRAEGSTAPTENTMHATPSLIKGTLHDLGDGFTVRRMLPMPEARHVGPLVFFDHMGPAAFAAGTGMDVRPHPHIGLATVTWLFEGAIRHRDSLGSLADIYPGEVNWMTAGRGIAHSERTPPEQRRDGQTLHGVQIWVALPQVDAEVAAEFHHHERAALPRLEWPGVEAVLIAGNAYGKASPVKVFAPMFLLEVTLAEGAELALPEEHAERGVFVVEGVVEWGEVTVPARRMAVQSGTPAPPLRACEGSRLILFGGAPLDGERHLWWNFVATSRERIEQAKADWRAGAFGTVAGDEREFIPLPD